MKWNAKALAPLLLLVAGCTGGSGGYANTGLEPVNGQGSIAAQSWGGPDRGSARQDRPQQQAWQEQPQSYPQQDNRPQGTAGQPGASYERPDAGYDQPRQVQPQRQYQPQPQRPQQYQPNAQQDSYVDPSAGAVGPAGTSRAGRSDEVGYAGVRGVAGGDTGSVVAVHRSLPAGSFVEVTSLETGKTIIALVTATGSDNLADLSPGAAQALGATGELVPVRVRSINPTGPDQAALRSGQAAMQRPDTPPVLLNALRKQLPPGGPRYASTPQPQPNPGRATGQPTRPAATTAPRGGAGHYVQVGAFSNQTNANNLARSLGGFVRPGGGLFRVQMGPYRSAAEAQAARAEAARQGYGDARVFIQN